MGLGVRVKLVLLSVAVLVVVSFGFTALSLSLTRGWVEEDLKDRAIAFAREFAATIGDRRELESPAFLSEQIRQIIGIRRNVGCGIGSCGVPRPSLGGYVTGTGATDGVTAAGGR